MDGSSDLMEKNRSQCSCKRLSSDADFNDRYSLLFREGDGIHRLFVAAAVSIGVGADLVRDLH
jgi:hypothetical protein